MIATKPQDLPVYDRAVARYPHLAQSTSVRQFCTLLCRYVAVDTISPLEYLMIAKAANGDDWEIPNPAYAPQRRYSAKTIKRLPVNLNTRTDQDIIKHLENIENIQGYVKKLIRDDIIKAD